MRPILVVAAVAVIAVLAAGGFAAYHFTRPAPAKDCMVLALGGNKLCGADAAAWCRATDATRSEAMSQNLDAVRANLDSAVACASAMTDYPQQ